LVDARRKLILEIARDAARAHLTGALVSGQEDGIHNRGIDQPMPVHRRAILKGGLAAIAAAALPGFAPRAEPTRPQMRVIPSSGKSIPVVGLGTWITFNVGTDPVLLDESVAVMAAFSRQEEE
jgi:hypothetical protein